MSNFICQNEVNMANEPFKVQQPLLESSSEITVFYQNRTFSSHQDYLDGDKFSCLRILSD